MKQCNTCKTELELSKFQVKGKKKDGTSIYRGSCKECRLTAERKQARCNSQKKYFASEKGKEKMMKYKNTDSYKEVQKKYRISIKGKEAIVRARLTNKYKDTQRRYFQSLVGKETKVKYLSNPENLFKQRSIKRIYIARKKYGDDIVTSSVRKEFITEKFKKQKHKCPSCKTKISLKDPKSYQIDHIIPFCQGGTHEESNIQFMCPKCHRLKSGLERKLF